MTIVSGGSPDITPYVDLTLYDTDAQTVLSRILANLRAAFPGWQPREGQSEVVLAEAFSVEEMELIYALNRMPGAIFEVLLRLYGLTRDPGAAPGATVTFTMLDALGHTVPEGTRLQVPYGPNAALTLQVRTTAPLQIPAGQTTGTVAVSGLNFQSAPNGIPSGAVCQLIDNVAWVASAVLASPVSDGRDPEDATGFRNRGASRLQRLVSTLVLPEHFAAAALDSPGVSRAVAIDNYDGSTNGVPGSAPGHVTVAVLGEGGAALSADAKTALQSTLAAECAAMLAVHIINPTLTTVDVDVTVSPTASAVPSTVTAAVTEAVEAWLSPDTWAWGSTVRLNQLIAVVAAVPGVDYVAKVTAPAADIVLSGAAPLAAAGAITVRTAT